MTTDILTELRKQTELMEKILRRLEQLEMSFDMEGGTVNVYNYEHYHERK